MLLDASMVDDGESKGGRGLRRREVMMDGKRYGWEEGGMERWRDGGMEG